METKLPAPFQFLMAIILIVGMACSVPFLTQQSETPQQPPVVPPAAPLSTATLASVESNPPPSLPTPTNTPVITHVNLPSSGVDMGTIVYDVESSGTAPEKRAPYGDSYDIYRMERPFDKEMTYIPDMDIVTYNVKLTEEWVYVSIELIGNNTNNELGIHYGVELDLTGDGFGDYIIWSNPPYTPDWSTNGVQVFKDENHDTGGLSAEKSDAPFDGDGYEKKIFDSGIGDDPDLAWVRVYAGRQATVQFAFKTSMAGTSFLLGVLSDTGLKDVGRMYYNDRFTEPEAGSPVKDKKYYPLNELYAFDNACRTPFNFSATGYEPLLCPRDEPKPKPGVTPQACQPPPNGCPEDWWWMPEPDCRCETLY